MIHMGKSYFHKKISYIKMQIDKEDKEESSQRYECRPCKRNFKYENTLITHMENSYFHRKTNTYPTIERKDNETEGNDEAGEDTNTLREIDEADEISSTYKKFRRGLATFRQKYLCIID